MPRANRYFLPDHVWHITHRCHKKEFLLKFATDRRAWIRWLFEARKRYGLEVLNYTVTSNHIHLLVYSNHDRGTVPRALQLVAGRVGQEYNQRKNRNGAFWEDRYHATAVDSGEHLVRCLIYIDLNMVRAGVVDHPREWRHGGWHEIVDPPRRYRIIARDRLKQLLDADEKTLTENYEHWVEDYIVEGINREKTWTDAIAAGSAEFVEGVKSRLGLKARHRQIRRKGNGKGAVYVLEEPLVAYSADFGGKIGILRGENRLSWNVFDDI
ncbi:MAG: transposase [Thermodesulfobacteriota bacterium]